MALFTLSMYKYLGTRSKDWYYFNVFNVRLIFQTVNSKRVNNMNLHRNRYFLMYIMFGEFLWGFFCVNNFCKVNTVKHGYYSN